MKKKIIIIILTLIALIAVIVGIYFSLQKNVKLITAITNYAKAYDPFLGDFQGIDYNYTFDDPFLGGFNDNYYDDPFLGGFNDNNYDDPFLGGFDNNYNEGSFLAQPNRPGYTTSTNWNIVQDYWKLPINNYWPEVPGTTYVQGDYWIPKDLSGRQVYCLEPGAHINYYYQAGYSDSAEYQSTGYYDLPIAAAYIVSADNRGYGGVESWAQKQQALWNLRKNGLNNLYDSGYSSYGFIESDSISEHDKRIKCL